MKLLGSLAFLLLVVATSGCSGSSKRAQQAAQRFNQAWVKDSTAHAVTLAQASLDSCDNDIDKSFFRKEFLKTLQDAGNDTALLAAQILMLDNPSLIDDTAYPIVKGLLDGSLSKNEALRRVQLVHRLHRVVKKAAHIETWNQGLQRCMDDLPVDQQMKVYAAVSSPHTLGQALKKDNQDKAGNETTIAAQVKALKKIYNEKQFAEFYSSFHSIEK